MKKSLPPINDYCVSFLDILGMKRALKGQAMRPVSPTDAERQALERAYMDSIGVILKLQSLANGIIDASKRVGNRSTSFAQALEGEPRNIWDAMSYTEVHMQPWSDGLVYFSNLDAPRQKCPINAVFEILATAGALYIHGLAFKFPIRGGIDIAWGSELEKGSLYGPALARAYEIESEVAQWPRIVVHDRVESYLVAALNSPETDYFAENNRALASVCLGLLTRDIDDHLIVDVLGTTFRETLTQDEHPELYGKSRNNIEAQLDYSRRHNDTKLALRYSHLLAYFDRNPISFRPGMCIAPHHS